MKRRNPDDGIVKKPLKISVEEESSDEQDKQSLTEPSVIVEPAVEPAVIVVEVVEKQSSVIHNENSRIENIKKEAIEKLMSIKNDEVNAMHSLKAIENPNDFHMHINQGLKPKKHKKKKVVYVSESEDSSDE
jgi:hypothetical protein